MHWPWPRGWLVSAFSRSPMQACSSWLYNELNMPCLVLFQRLYISRYHTRGSLWFPTPQTATQSHCIHGSTTGGFREDFPENSLSWCCDAGAPGHVHQLTRGPCAGETSGSIFDLKLGVFLLFPIEMDFSLFDIRCGSRTAAQSFARSSEACRKNNCRSRKTHQQMGTWQRVIRRSHHPP